MGKVASKAKASVPKYVNAAKEKVGEGATVVKKKGEQAAAAVKKSAGQAATAVKETAGQAYRAVKKTAKEAGEAVEQTIHSAADYVEQAYTDIAARNQNIVNRLKPEFAQYYQEVKRGITQKGVAYQFLGALDQLDLLLEMRKAVVEEYPILARNEIQRREAYERIRNGIIKGGDKIGNNVYHQNIPVISDLVGGMFHASEGRRRTSIKIRY